jgi:hypothetical protein
MSQRPISLSPDLSRLRAEGYDLRVERGFLVVRDVPYLDAAGTVVRGMLVKALTLAGDVATAPGDHTIYLAGPLPHDGQGRLMTNVVNSSGPQRLLPDLVTDHYLSHKPAQGYPDFYELVTTYVNVLSKHAQGVDPDVTAQTFPVIEAAEDDDGPFLYIDTASARAGIAAVNAKVESQKIAIVGLGGTGAYLLDLIAKSPVAQIDLYDGDILLQHNAFRYPGAVPLKALEAKLKKVDYLAEKYSVMRRGVIPHAYHLVEGNVNELLPADFVFLAVDDNPSRAMIAKWLETAGKPFIDVGMGLYEAEGSIGGQIRVTSSFPGHRDHLWDERHRLPTSSSADELYRQNVQIVDLNSFNAGLAVMRWKRYVGVFADLGREHNSVYAVDGNDILNEDH